MRILRRYLRRASLGLLVTLALSGCGKKPSPTIPDLKSEVVKEVSRFQIAKPLIALPPSPRLTEAGYKLILDYEVGGGQRYFERYLSRPTWPGASSGVTVGVGYDCGYNSRSVILSDWRELPEAPRLADASGVTGAAAKARLARVRDILVAWGMAEGVFNRVSVTRFWQLTRRTYPGFDALRPNAQAALLSITFNRGSSLTGNRRRELRRIRDCVPRRDYAGMARANRDSIRIWRGTAIETGMARRRNAEADLILTR